MKKNYIKIKGFTLIELLVVIAIIGMLSSIVLSALNSARGKAANSAIKENMAHSRSIAELYYDKNNNYSVLCVDPLFGFQRQSDAAYQAYTGSSVSTCATASPASNCNCRNVSSAWALQVILKTPEGSNTWWCVDSLGNSKGESIALAGTVCP